MFIKKIHYRGINNLYYIMCRPFKKRQLKNSLITEKQSEVTCKVCLEIFRINKNRFVPHFSKEDIPQEKINEILEPLIKKEV